ncbi:31795_t:CDS:2, partial [Gigaspora margarita]
GMIEGEDHMRMLIAPKRNGMGGIETCIYNHTYIDNACHVTITTLLGRIEEMMNRQAETQRLWNEQMQKALDEHFSNPSDNMLTTSNKGRTTAR